MSAGLALRLGFVVAAVAAGTALAHERDDRALGVVESVSAERIVVRAADGHAVPFALTPETRFFRGEAPARREDVRVGERVVVHGKAAPDGPAEAVRVRLGPAGG